MKQLISKNQTMVITGRPGLLTFQKRSHGKGTYHQARANVMINDGDEITPMRLILNTGHNMIKNILTVAEVFDLWVRVNTIYQDTDGGKNNLIIHVSPINRPEDEDASPDFEMKLTDDLIHLII